MRNRTCSLAGWLEMPNDSIEGRMFNNLGNSESHFLVLSNDDGTGWLLRSEYLLMLVGEAEDRKVLMMPPVPLE